MGIAFELRTPGRLLGPQDFSVVRLQETSVVLDRRVTELHSDTTPMFRKMATDEFATGLVRALMTNAGKPG